MELLIHTSRYLLLSLLLFATACTLRPAESAQTRSLVPTEAVTLFDGDKSKSNTSISNKGVVTILALSGGGAEGAFGAGLLAGWSETGTRPNFDVVTGVSTGGLMAVLAFLGPQYDPLMRELYTTQTNRDIYTQKGPAGLLSDSLYDNTPLKLQIEKYVTASLVAKIAAEHAAGRRLYIATTNLDAGELVVWNMGEIASGNRANPVQLFQKILRATSAVPGLFKPVYIKPVKGVQLRQAHVDGGVKSPVLLSDFLFRVKAKKRKLYVVINDQLSRRSAHAAVKSEVADIARKSIHELTRKLLYTNAYQGYVRARNSGTEYNLAAIPDSFPPSKKSLDFNPRRMKKLYALGLKRARSGKVWANEPPRLQKFDRIAVR